jgi:hypothetical protein
MLGLLCHVVGFVVAGLQTDAFSYWQLSPESEQRTRLKAGHYKIVRVS